MSDSVMANRGDVFLGNITDGKYCHGFVTSLLESEVGGICLYQGPPYLDSNRNQVVKEFLKSDCSKLHFVDSDEAWVQDDIDTLNTVCTEDTPIVGGVYYNVYKSGLSPVIYDWKYDPDEFKQDILVEVGKEAWDKTVANADNALIQVTAIGTGFLMIHRSVFIRFAEVYSTPSPYFAQLICPGGNQSAESVPRLYGEDLTFCCRAAALDIPIYAHADVSIAHDKNVRLKF